MAAEVAQRVPTIDDLKVKFCYICREEELFDKPENPPRAWTHPCKCTLIAHESCLLRWIQTSQSDTSRVANALKCPQCGATYEIESDNPVPLQILDAGNRTLSILGRMVTAAGLTAVIVSFGTGIYVLSTGYGAYALNQFLGKDMYDLLLTDNPSAWPWHAFINLPLIPISLILSQTPLPSAVVPLIPVLLPWPTSTPVRSRERILLERWRASSSVSTPDLTPAPWPSWPPSPAFLGLLVLPLARAFYRSVFTRFTHWVLKTQPARRPPVTRIMLAMNAPFRIRIGANIEEPPAAQANGQRLPNANGDANDAALALAAEDVIQVTGSSLGRLIGGALILPTISSFMGSILFRLSHHSFLLRRFLAIRPSMMDVPPPLGQWSYSDNWAKLSPIKQMEVAARLVLSVAWRGTRTWAECDPVWWRNSLGLGIFLVAKDCLHLLHLWYTKRELETRRVKNKSFEGIDIRELDLVEHGV